MIGFCQRALSLLLILSAGAALCAADLPLKVTLSGDPGQYDKTHWKKDWPGCQFEGGIAGGRVQIVQDSDGKKWLRVNFAGGKIGPEDGGAGWRWPIGKHEAAQLSYTVRFSPEFDFVKGGKLPGLCGGPDNVSGGRRATGTNGFSARLMWRRNGRGEGYIYHKNQPADYGQSFAFPADFRFPLNQPIKVRLAVSMNTPGKPDGTLRIWITLQGRQERLLVERTDMEWRTVNTFGVDGLYFETFYGGNDATWAPQKDGCWAEFTDFKIEAP